VASAPPAQQGDCRCLGGHVHRVIRQRLRAVRDYSECASGHAMSRVCPSRAGLGGVVAKFGGSRRLEQQWDQDMLDALRSLGASGSGARIFRKVPSPERQ
jgi:hypothetical protein